MGSGCEGLHGRRTDQQSTGQYTKVHARIAGHRSVVLVKERIAEDGNLDLELRRRKFGGEVDVVR